MGIEFNNQQIYALYDIENWWYKSNDQVYNLSGAAGTGKAEPIDTLIPTPSGEVRMGDLKIGDYVFNRHGEPIKVIGTFDQGELEVYKVTFDDGRYTLCNDEHLWSYFDINGNLVTTSLRDIMNDGRYDTYPIPVAKSDTVTYITDIRDLGYKTEMRCIYVDDPEHLYLTHDYVVTHNTTLIRYFIERIGLELTDVAFVAYMGKAACNMARSGLPAQTIHSFIYTCEKVLDLDENGKIQYNERGKQKMKFVFIKRERLVKDVKLIIVDEAGMVNEDIAMDLLSYGIPIIALGDLNQLPPVFGKPYFLKEPNFILTQVMRQAEGNPIIWLAHRALNGLPLQNGVYGKSVVTSKDDLNPFVLKNANVVLTATNRLRSEINTLFRENLLKLKRLDMPNEGEKIICRRNNWGRSIGESLYLTNGMSGTIDYLDMESFNGKSLMVDFKPDFVNKKFKNLKIDYKKLMSDINSGEQQLNYGMDQFEFAYAITVTLSQGSQFNNVVLLDEPGVFDKTTYRKLMYTGITRAIDSITIYH